MRVADYITRRLYEAGGEHVFLVTGGMIMHLTDALTQFSQQSFICCHHEQSATMAAEAYGRYTGKLGVAYVTAGPGALNTITGVVGAYVDSAPCIVVAGQSKLAHATITGPRQFALQGFNNLPLFRQITKHAVMLSDLSKVRYEIEKAIFLATHGRPGPVYVECPVDVQAMTFDPEEHIGFDPTLEPDLMEFRTPDSGEVARLLERLARAERPCILAGAGVRSAGAVDLLHRFAEHLNMPVLTSRLGMDLIGDEHPLFIGRPGTYGDRPANFTLQNCDFLLVIGCRLGMGLVGYADPKTFAPHAFKVSVDVDEQELNKPLVRYDQTLLLDAGAFLQTALDLLPPERQPRLRWVAQTQSWKSQYPVDLPEYAQESTGINSYHFTRLFAERLKNDAVVVLDTGSCFHVHAQAFKVKFGQRHIITGGLSTMGYCPASIGVAAACKGGDVYCITGDGSVQFNLQEFETIAYNRLPVKTVIYNNGGYLLIRLTQSNFCENRRIGESSHTGVGFPDMSKIADAYGIHYLRIESPTELDSKLEELISHPGPVICEVLNPPEQLLMPRVASKRLEDGTMMSMPFDDMFPFLPRDEYEANCVWKTWSNP